MRRRIIRLDSFRSLKIETYVFEAAVDAFDADSPEGWQRYEESYKRAKIDLLAAMSQYEAEMFPSDEQHETLPMPSEVKPEAPVVRDATTDAVVVTVPFWTRWKIGAYITGGVTGLIAFINYCFTHPDQTMQLLTILGSIATAIQAANSGAKAQVKP